MPTMEKEFEVKNFVYNGFSGKSLPGMASYKAKFLNWTADPGIARFRCSDGDLRLIPTFALKDLNSGDLPTQTYGNNKVIFGVPSRS